MEGLNKAVDLLLHSGHTVAFTGAGISVESGIPPFRGEGGLWNKYDPEVLDINFFYAHPLESWQAIREIFYDFFNQARPNAAHTVLAKMESAGMLSSVITQNIDNLHQLAGSKTVYEYHGNSSRLVCPECGNQTPVPEVDLSELPPRCRADGAVLKPDFVFFGEGIPEFAARKSDEEARAAEVMLIIGSTGEVMPAAFIPRIAKENGAMIIEINPRESLFTRTISDIHLQGRAGEVMEKLAKKIGIA